MNALRKLAVTIELRRGGNDENGPQNVPRLTRVPANELFIVANNLRGRFGEEDELLLTDLCPDVRMEFSPQCRLRSLRNSASLHLVKYMAGA